MARKVGSFKEPPYLGLGEALEISHAVYSRMGGSAMRDDLAQVLGNTPSSSSFVKKMSALRAFGLMEENGPNNYRLTPLAYQIVAPGSRLEEARARLEVFRNINVFAKLHDQYKGKVCPETTYLANTIERDLGVPTGAKVRWAQAFLEAIESAGLQSMQGGRTVIRSDISVLDSQPVETQEDRYMETETRSNEQKHSPPQEREEPGTSNFVFPFAGKGAVRIQMPDNLSQQEITKLLKLLEISLKDDVSA
jgi:hypothetical protein